MRYKDTKAKFNRVELFSNDESFKVYDLKSKCLKYFKIS
jgi:hypothetical protein